MKFFITDYNKEDIEFAERYTLSTFIPNRENIQHHPPLNYIKEKKKWAFRTIYGDDIYLTEDEAILPILNPYFVSKSFITLEGVLPFPL